MMRRLSSQIVEGIVGNALYVIVFVLLFTWVIGLIEYSVNGLVFVLLETAVLLVVIRISSLSKAHRGRVHRILPNSERPFPAYVFRRTRKRPATLI